SRRAGCNAHREYRQQSNCHQTQANYTDATKDSVAHTLSPLHGKPHAKYLQGPEAWAFLLDLWVIQRPQSYTTPALVRPEDLLSSLFSKSGFPVVTLINNELLTT